MRVVPRSRKLVLPLLAALIVLVGASAWWYRTRPAQRVRDARAAVRRGDWEAAQPPLDARGAGGEQESYLLQAELLYRAGRPAEAVRELNRIRGEGPVRVRAAALGGWCFLNVDNYWEAMRHFQYALEQDPDNLAAHRGM